MKMKFKFSKYMAISSSERISQTLRTTACYICLLCLLKYLCFKHNRKSHYKTIVVLGVLSHSSAVHHYKVSYRPSWNTTNSLCILCYIICHKLRNRRNYYGYSLYLIFIDSSVKNNEIMYQLLCCIMLVFFFQIYMYMKYVI